MAQDQNAKSLPDMIWDQLTQEIADLSKRIDTLEARTERSETTSGHPTATLATLPLAANGAKGGDELWVSDWPNSGAAAGALTYYNPNTDSYVPIADYPRRWTGWHEESTILSGGALPFLINTAQVHNGGASQSPIANGDSFSQSFVLAAGTYTLYVLGWTNTNRGKIDWYIDNVLNISGQDWYAGVLTSNIVLSGTVTVIGSGRHILKAVVNGKNASSSDYAATLTKFWLKPVTD